MSLKNKIVFLTGGTGDIGREIITKLVDSGAKVYFTYRSNEEGAKKISETNLEKIVPVRLNIEDYKEVSETIKQIISKEKYIDILVNNAGINNDKLLAMMPEKDWNDVISTNLNGTYNCCKAVIRNMICHRHGTIINIASVSGAVKGIAGQCNYGASKAGIIGLTRALAQEVGGFSIRVNCVAPGFIKSSMVHKINQDMLAGYVEQIPLKRIGETREVANVVRFLASEESSYITGNVITVDGGLSA